MDKDAVTFVPFSSYDWSGGTISKWLPWKYVLVILYTALTCLIKDCSPLAYCLIASFCAVAYWMSIEIIVLVYITFKRHSGLYFWSIIVNTVGIILQTTGFILLRFRNDWPEPLSFTLSKVGWAMNVSTFSLVLWSRLHLVVRDSRVLNRVLVMIIINGVLCLSSSAIFEFGLSRSKYQTMFALSTNIIERVQQAIYTVQETIISFLYIYYITQFLGGVHALFRNKVTCLLVCVQILAVVLDAALSFTVYTDRFILRCAIHPFLYTVKLKLEFIVLNQLQTFFKRDIGTSNLRDANSHNPLPLVEQISLPPSKTNVVTMPGTTMAPKCPSLSFSTTEPLGNKVIQQRKGRHTSNQTLQSEQCDWIGVVGKSDSERDSLDDLEAFYLGRWDGVRRLQVG
jgi:hypothetical protein